MAAIVDGLVNIVVLDTNILIDFLQGHHQSKVLFENYKTKATTIIISIITVVEVLVGIFDPEKRKNISLWLQSFQTIAVGSEIANAAVALRQTFRLKVPDALIMATAQCHRGTLVTRDQDFRRIPGVHCPYTLHE